MTANSRFVIASLIAGLSPVTSSQAADAPRPIVVTGNFQMQVPLEGASSTSDIVTALAQANASLSDLMAKQCALLSESFKRDCRVIQLNFGSSYSDNNAARYVRPGTFEQPATGNANLNVTFQLTQSAAPAKP